MEAAIEEAKKLTDPPIANTFEWECNCPPSKFFADACRVDYDAEKTYEGGVVSIMSLRDIQSY